MISSSLVGISYRIVELSLIELRPVIFWDIFHTLKLASLVS